MLGIQESVSGGSDDWVIDLWWLRSDNLTGKFVSSSGIWRKVVWKSHVWGILGVWIISSSSLSLAGGNDGVGQVILKWDSSIGTSLTLAIWELNPSSSDSGTASRSSLGEGNNVVSWVLNIVEFITLHGNILAKILISIHTGEGFVQLNGVDSSKQSG